MRVETIWKVTGSALCRGFQAFTDHRAVGWGGARERKIKKYKCSLFPSHVHTHTNTHIHMYLWIVGKANNEKKDKGIK